MNQLWFGDNLTILREEIASGSVDLIYLDPPFNSNANYNVLFRTPSDEAANAQVEAFRDTWTWGNEAQWALDEIMRTGGSVATIVHALHAALGCQSACKIHPLSASNFDPPCYVDQRLACPALAGVAEGRPSAGDDRLRL